jgi:hypothetical protein
MRVDLNRKWRVDQIQEAMRVDLNHKWKVDQVQEAMRVDLNLKWKVDQIQEAMKADLNRKERADQHQGATRADQHLKWRVDLRLLLIEEIMVAVVLGDQLQVEEEEGILEEDLGNKMTSLNHKAKSDMV